MEARYSDRAVILLGRSLPLIIERSPGVFELISEAEYQAQSLKETKRQNLLARIADLFETDFLRTDTFYRERCADVISLEEFENIKAAFVRSWLKSQTGTLLDPEQASAVAATHGHIQIIARAGSGKTTTLVNRAFFLQRHCGVAPDEMLLVAFNRRAAEEMAERLGKMLDGSIPHVMTFHALGYAIVHPDESLLYNGPLGESQGLSRAFQDVIDDHLQLAEFKEQVRELMLAHFREDWERIVTGGYDKNKDELLQFRRSLPRESLRGDYVKSFGEKVIADFLFEHDIPYRYERNHWWGNINYRPDFTIFKGEKSGIVIEYFGLAGDPDYDKMSQKKREYWSDNHQWSFLEFGPHDIVENEVEGFRQLLKNRLEAEGITCKPLSEDELWLRIRKRAIDRFTIASVAFTGHCRKRWLPPGQLVELIQRHTALSPVESMFLRIAQRLYAAYLDRLSATGEEDFDGLMQRAAQAVAKGQTAFERKSGRGDLKKLRYVFVDEYQDFSELFHRLIEAIRKQNPKAEFFCVGDDWQAINGFAGSDLRFYETFDVYFAHSRRLYISTNYRSSASIVEVGNALMNGLGKPAVAHKKSAGLVLLADLSKFVPSVLEQERHPGDMITPIVLRLAGKALATDHEVALLCRRNGVPWFVNFKAHDRYLEILRAYFPKNFRKQITLSTVHKYKGLGKQMVVVLDAVARSYPLMHPDWVFSRIFGDNLEKITAEERRLFYVALTRAVETLVVVTESGSYSPFLNDIQDKVQMSEIHWPEFPSVPSSISRLVVKVGNQRYKGSRPTIAIMDLLKAEGFKWRTTDWEGWVKSFPVEGFSIEALQDTLWAAKADGIEVRVFDDHDTLIARYLVDGGRWHRIIDKMTEVCEMR